MSYKLATQITTWCGVASSEVNKQNAVAFAGGEYTKLVAIGSAEKRKRKTKYERSMILRKRTQKSRRVEHLP